MSLSAEGTAFAQPMPEIKEAMSTTDFNQQLVNLRQPLFYFALSLTHDRDNAHDLMQESMLRALTYSDKFHDNTNFKAWVYTIMKNTFINGHRRNKRTDRVMDHVERVRERASLVETPATPESSVRMKEIQGALGRLDEIFRKPFQLHNDGYKYHEIADRLSIPVGTVKSRIHQARHRLMGMLEDQPA
jgi:RNA polymerase sigma-70 factor (ECF subfamily)